MKLNLKFIKDSESIPKELSDMNIDYSDLPTVKYLLDRTNLKDKYVIKFIDGEFQVLPDGSPDSDMYFLSSYEKVLKSKLDITLESSEKLNRDLYNLEFKVYGKECDISLKGPDLSELICQELRNYLYFYGITKYNNHVSINVSIKSEEGNSTFIVNYFDEDDKKYTEELITQSLESSINSYLNLVFNGSFSIDTSDVKFTYVKSDTPRDELNVLSNHDYE